MEFKSTRAEWLWHISQLRLDQKFYTDLLAACAAAEPVNDTDRDAIERTRAMAERGQADVGKLLEVYDNGRT